MKILIRKSLLFIFKLGPLTHFRMHEKSREDQIPRLHSVEHMALNSHSSLLRSRGNWHLLSTSCMAGVMPEPQQPHFSLIRYIKKKNPLKKQVSISSDLKLFFLFFLLHRVGVGQILHPGALSPAPSMKKALYEGLCAIRTHNLWLAYSPGSIQRTLVQQWFSKHQLLTQRSHASLSSTHHTITKWQNPTKNICGTELLASLAPESLDSFANANTVFGCHRTPFVFDTSHCFAHFKYSNFKLQFKHSNFKSSQF